MADTSTFKRPPPPTSPEVLKLGRTLFADEKAVLTPEQEKACQSLSDDEFDRLPVAEKRGFWNDVVKRELKRNGASAGAIAGSGLASGETPTSIALAEVAKAGGPNAQAVEKARVRLRTLVVECLSCENLTLYRFKSEDDLCRVCGELLPISPEFGQDKDAGHVAAALVEESPAANVATEAPPKLPADPVTWEVVKTQHDPKKLLALSKENQDWDEVLAAIRKVEEESRRKSEEEAAKKRAEEDARRKAEERKRVEEEAKRAAVEKIKREAEEKKRHEEEQLRVFAETQKKAEAERVAKEAEVKRKQEEELAVFHAKQAQEAAEKKARDEEEERLRKIEDARLAIGRLAGDGAGKIVRINDLNPSIKPGQSKTPLCLMVQGKAKLLVPAGAKAFVNDAPVVGICELKPGDIIKGLMEEDDLSVIEENGELRGVNADPIHLKREDSGGGGPWPYWNEPIKIGASDQCEVLVGEPGVDEIHATVTTWFGRVIVEDACTEADGLWIDAARVKAFVARPDMKFRLGNKGPVLGIGQGPVEVKAKEEAKAGPMKPARYVRTVLNVEDKKGRTEKVFLFARREIRFGRLFSKGDKVENDLVIAPEDDIQTVGDKQGSLSLTRDGVALRQDDRVVPMSLNDEEMKPGQSLQLKRRFTIDIGVGITLRGEVYRAPTSMKRPDSGPGQLGIEGGHPYECVRMVREDSSGHTYVFLVRAIRLGTGPGDSIQIDDTEVGPGHASIYLARGVLQIVAPREKYKVSVHGEALEPGKPRPLKIGAKIEMGSTTIKFEITSEADFKVSE